MGMMAKESGFDLGQGKDIFLFNCICVGSGDHPALYSVPGLFQHL